MKLTVFRHCYFLLEKRKSVDYNNNNNRRINKPKVLLKAKVVCVRSGRFDYFALVGMSGCGVSEEGKREALCWRAPKWAKIVG